MISYLKLLRIHHYIKNFLVFVALVCSRNLFNLDLFYKVCLGFVSFCLISSAVYIFNDICDVKKDRLHPKNKFRPIASGKIPKNNAIVLMIILVLLVFLLNIYLFSLKSLLIIFLYFILNIFYSFKLKNIPIVDLAILVFGFFIRVLYGAFIVNISISNWLYLIVICAAFYFSLGKRKNELKKNKSRSRSVLNYYTAAYLEHNMYMFLTLTNVFYVFWSMDDDTIVHYGTDNLVFTFPLVLMITMKYSLNINNNIDGNPVDVLLSDKILIFLCLLYVFIIFLILYL